MKQLGSYSAEEIEIVTTAISKHSKKRKAHGIYDELLKDADVMSHSFYNTGYPVAEKEKVRYEKLLAELFT